MKWKFENLLTAKITSQLEMPINPKRLLTILTEEITQRIMNGSMSLRDLDKAHSYADRDRILNAVAEAAREEFWKTNFRRFNAELIMRTAEVFEVTEDMGIGWDGDREYIQDIYIKERFSEREHPRVIKQFADNQWEEEEWEDFMEFIKEERRKEILEEFGVEDEMYF